MSTGKPAATDAAGVELDAAKLSGEALRELAKTVLGRVPPNISDERLRARVLEAQVALRELQIEDATVDAAGEA